MRNGGDHPQVVRFGEFTLDLARMALLHGRERLHLTEKPLEVLVLLVQNAGRTVSKQDLIDGVWKDTFVTEDNLTQAILKIRRVLGDEKENPQFIQTVPRVGYRFVGMAASLKPVPPKAETSVAGERIRQRVPRSTWMFAAGLLMILLAAAGLWRAGSFRAAGHPEEPPTRAAAPVPLEVPLPTESATKPTYSPDGSRFLYVGYRKERPGIGDLYVASPSGSAAKQISEGLDPRGDHPVFSPDATEVVFSRWRSGDDGTRWPDLWVMPAVGGSARVLLRQASGAGFSPDGNWIGYTKHLPGSRALWISPRTDLSKHQEVGPLGFTPRWSADGKWIAYTTSNPEGGPGELWIASTDLSARRRLTTEPEQMFGISWLPDSLSLVFAASQGGDFLLWKIAIHGEPRTMLGGWIGSCYSPSASPDGQVMLFSHVLPSRNLYYVASLKSDSEAELTRGQYHVWPALSPNGALIASVIQMRGFENRVYTTPVAGGPSVRGSDRPASHPAWVDDGHLAYLCDDAAGGTEVRVAAVPGGVDRALCRFPESASWLALHADGRQIAVVLTAANKRQRIEVRDLVTGRSQTLTEGEEYEHLRWVPGSNLLSWSGPLKSAGPQSDGIWIAEPGGPGPKHLIPDGHNPAWNNGGTVVYYSRIGEHSGLWSFDLRSSKSAKIRGWTEVNYFDVRGASLVFARVASDTHVFRLPLR